MIELILISPLLLAGTLYGILRWGRQALPVLVPVVVLAIAYTVWREPSALMFVTMPCIIAGAVALSVTEGLSTKWVLVGGGLVIAGIWLGGYYYQKFVLGVDSVKVAAEMIIDIMSTVSVDNEQKARTLDLLAFVKEYAHIGLPGWFFFEGTIWCALGYLALRRLFLRLARRVRMPRKGMSQFRVNDHFVFLLILSAAITFFGKDRLPYEAYYFGVNGLLVLTVLYFFQGIGIFQHYIETRRMPGFMLPIILITGLFLGLPLIVVSFASVGVGDIWFDFRRPVVKKPDDDNNE